VEDWLKVAIGAAIGGVLALIAAVATGWFSFASKDEELWVHLVEIAIGILRADPKEDVSPARGWAMDAIDKYSGLRPFTADERAALSHKPIGGALPADAELPEWKKTFKGYGRDGFIIIPPRGAPGWVYYRTAGVPKGLVCHQGAQGWVWRLTTQGARKGLASHRT
jgi:hypothetical protein